MSVWTLEQLQAIVLDKTQERYNLEFKSCDELRWGEGTYDPKNPSQPKSRDSVIEELSRDISAMANSAGGTIIYGIKENRNTSTAKKFDDAPFMPPESTLRSPEWLDVVIRNSISPSPNVKITPVFIHEDKEKGWYYVIDVEQGVTAHQARDKKFYKRLNTTRSEMEQYEIVDVINRAKGPILREQWKYWHKGIETTQFKALGTGNPTKPTLPFIRIDLSLEMTSINYISAEYGNFRIYVVHPLWVIGPSSVLPASKAGINVGSYPEQAHAQLISYNWSVHQAGGVYPGAWTNLNFPGVFLLLPPPDVIDDSLYLIKIEINGPNAPTYTSWLEISASTHSPDIWRIQKLDQISDELAGKFWHTYRKGIEYRNQLS